jgi:YHS domain-containing protein/thiol-disulfide isomerase/thioredoxin
MRCIRVIGVVSFALLAVAVGHSAADDVWRNDFETALAEAKRLNRPLLVHFHADWCGPCRQMEQNVLRREQVQRELRRLVIPVKVNTDRAPAIAERYHIDQLPTDLFLEPDGTPIVESTGYRGANEYVSAAGRAALKYADLLAQRAQQNSQPAVDPGAGTTSLAAAAERKPMLGGYSPVTLWKNRKWEKGSPQFQSDYKGQVYQMASVEEQQEFNENPTRYAPRFLGCDPVIVYQSDRAVLGSTKFGAFYDDELYLFVNNDNRQAFKANPDQYIRTRVVLRADQIEQVVR